MKWPGERCNSLLDCHHVELLREPAGPDFGMPTVRNQAVVSTKPAHRGGA